MPGVIVVSLGGEASHDEVQLGNQGGMTTVTHDRTIKCDTIQCSVLLNSMYYYHTIAHKLHHVRFNAFLQGFPR